MQECVLITLLKYMTAFVAALLMFPVPEYVAAGMQKEIKPYQNN